MSNTLRDIVDLYFKGYDLREIIEQHKENNSEELLSKILASWEGL